MEEAEANEAESNATDDSLHLPSSEYKMVDDLFYAAKKAPPESPDPFCPTRTIGIRQKMDRRIESRCITVPVDIRWSASARSILRTRRPSVSTWSGW